jgi:hypothetical protein
MSDHLTLSKRIPARTKTVKFTWVKRDFMPWSTFSKTRQTPNSCWWCHHSFEGDEMLALAGRFRKTNVLICQSCADRALEADDE